MASNVQYQRQLFFQVHCGVNLLCFAITLMCVVALKFSIGLLQLFALILPLVGIASFFVNDSVSKGRKVVKECYCFGSMASLISLLLVSQLLFQFSVAGWIWELAYFIVTAAAVIAIGYFILLADSLLLSKTLTPISIVAGLIIGLLVAIVIYKFFICYFFTPGFLIFWSYTFWIIDLILKVLVCLDLRIILFKGR